MAVDGQPKAHVLFFKFLASERQYSKFGYVSSWLRFNFQSVSINCTLCKKIWKLKDPKHLLVFLTIVWLCYVWFGHGEITDNFHVFQRYDRHKTSQVGFDCHGFLTNTSFK